ncbi:guanylate kinase [Flavobacterium sp. 103]|nr:guanylate kinase [Flavobacterium sp. 103]
MQEKHKTMKKGKLIVFSAPSGSGKTTIVRHLLGKEDLNLEFSISAATREARGEEVSGKDYYFMSLEEFKKHIKAEDFVEWEEVYRDNFYGTLKSEVERIWAKGKNVIFDIDVAGGLRIKHKFPEETLAVFVKPPSVDELKRRLKERSTESDDKINMRIAKASVELATAPQFDVIIKNYDLPIALEEAYQLVKDFVNTDSTN